MDKNSIRQHRPLASTSGLKLRDCASLEYPMQLTLHERIESQHWVGVCAVTLPVFGRSLISTQRFAKDDIICDYHGTVVTGVKYEDYILSNTDVDPEFVMVVTGDHRRLVDACQETCPIHATTTMCMGRLANHAPPTSHQANMKPADVSIGSVNTSTRVVVFKAKRAIEPFEQLRYDYYDKTARKMFK